MGRHLKRIGLGLACLSVVAAVGGAGVGVLMFTSAVLGEAVVLGIGLGALVVYLAWAVGAALAKD